MFKNIFKKKSKEEGSEKNILVAALLVHAARIDENYTSKEKNIIKKALINLNNISEKDANELLLKAEKEEERSSQIIEFTREVKNQSMEYRLKIIEILLKIVYSDGASDDFESNLIRRVCGLLYISNKDSGILKLKIKNSRK
tara:strand:+ start:5941 stop:6366 length:426 start_codon:yes stop_codon:yes gene_type:complete